MSGIKKYDIGAISREICFVLAKHEVPVAMIDHVFDCAKNAAEFNAVIPKEYLEFKNTRN